LDFADKGNSFRGYVIKSLNEKFGESFGKQKENYYPLNVWFSIHEAFGRQYMLHSDRINFDAQAVYNDCYNIFSFCGGKKNAIVNPENKVIIERGAK